MNRLLRHAWLAGAALLLAAALPAHAQRVRKIMIEHLGPPAANNELIRANIRVKEGELFNPAAVNDDEKNLYATGLFLDIRVTQEATPEGLNLTYVLQGKPRLTEISFKGNKKYSTGKLRKKISSKMGDLLDERKLFNDKRTILEMYQKAGLQETTVDYVENIEQKAGRCSVHFEIVETPKVRIIDVVFDGAQAFPQKKLRKVVKTHRHWMFSWILGSGKLKKDQLEEDRDKLRDFYLDAGYIDFELKDVRYDYKSPTRMVLHFLVSEGRRYKVGAIAVNGATIFSTNQIISRLHMKVGQIFTPKGLEKDTEAIQDLYGARGYIGEGSAGRMEVLPRKSPNTDTGTMDLVYDLREGGKYYIQRIEIKGNVHTKDRVIRRELAVEPGEVFDMVRIKRSKARLEQMEYFERVETKPEESDIRGNKNLIVAVEEKSTGKLQVGAGFSTVDSLVGYVEISQPNFDLFKPPTFRGGGQKFRIFIQVGLQQQNYQVSFVEPWFLGRKLALGVDLYHRELNYLSDLFGERRTGAKVSLTRALGSDFRIGSLSLGVEDIGLININPDSPSTIVHSGGDHVVGRLQGSLSYDTRNNVTLPNHGQRTELFAEYVLGNFSLYRAELRSSWFFPGFAKDHVLELMGKIGVVDAIGTGLPDPTAGQQRPYWGTETEIDPVSGTPHIVLVPLSVQNMPANRVPFFERYFEGGPNTLRGFRYRAVSPHESGIHNVYSEPIGGDGMFLLSAEYSIPVIQYVRLAAFFDMGNVYYQPYEFDFGRFSANYGFGVRLNIPHLGPLRFDYGIPIVRANNESRSGQFNFSVGYTRGF